MQVVVADRSGDELPLLLDAASFAENSGGAYRADDPRIGALLEGASAAIRRYCGWHIAPQIIEDKTTDYEGGNLLVLPTLRLVSVEELELFGSRLDAGAFRVSTNGEIHLGRSYHVRLGEGFGAVRLSMQHGFDLEDVADLRAVVQQVVSNALASPTGATSERAGQVSVTWARTAPGVSGGISLLERDLALLDSYRLPKGA